MLTKSEWCLDGYIDIGLHDTTFSHKVVHDLETTTVTKVGSLKVVFYNYLLTSTVVNYGSVTTFK